MHRIKIPQQDFALKVQGGAYVRGGAYLRDTTVSVNLYVMILKTCGIYNIPPPHILMMQLFHNRRNY